MLSFLGELPHNPESTLVSHGFGSPWDLCRAMAAGSDVGPFPHGTQAREYVSMVKYGMTPLAALQAGLLNGAKLLGWDGQIGALKSGYYADIIAVPGDPLMALPLCKRSRL